jgi:hypothetical protein
VKWQCSVLVLGRGDFNARLGRSNSLLVQFAMNVLEVASCNDPHYQYHEFQSFPSVFLSDFCYTFYFLVYVAYVR